MIVTIDGPASAGKSTVAKKLANAVRFQHLDSGAFYRCYAYKAKELDTALQDSDSILELIRHADLEVDFSRSPACYLMNGKDISKEIRTNEISNIVAPVSQIPEIRSEVDQQLRKAALQGNFVIEGRDIGSVVFPDAEVKFFLTASIEERARRRHKELEQSGEKVSLETLMEDIRNRDLKDSSRKISPLIQPEDAVLIDCTSLSVDEVIDKMAKIVESQHKPVNGG